MVKGTVKLPTRQGLEVRTPPALAAPEDFRMLFAPKCSVLAEMQTMAPEPEEEVQEEREEEELGT